MLRHKLNTKSMRYGFHGENGNGNWFPLWKMDTETGSRFHFPRVKVCLWLWFPSTGKMETETGFRCGKWKRKPVFVSFTDLPWVRVCLWSIVKKIFRQKKAGRSTRRGYVVARVLDLSAGRKKRFPLYDMLYIYVGYHTEKFTLPVMQLQYRKFSDF